MKAITDIIILFYYPLTFFAIIHMRDLLLKFIHFQLQTDQIKNTSHD